MMHEDIDISPHLAGKGSENRVLVAHDRRDECATDGYVVEFVSELHATF